MFSPAGFILQVGFTFLNINLHNWKEKSIFAQSKEAKTMEKLITREQYDKVKARVEELITKATQKGMLEPDSENEYTREIGDLSKLMADYEDEYLNILPLRKKSPLIASIEEYFYAHGMKQKDGARLLGVNESQFSQIMSGRRRISMSFAKRLRSKMGIDANLILEYA